MKLIKPTPQWETAYLNFIQEWAFYNEPITPFAARLQGKNYQEWLNHNHVNEFVETCPKEFVPSSTFFLIEGDRILGAVHIRHFLNERLLSIGGHIGYGIRPTERGKGYAPQMLKLALLIAKDLGIKKALLTCSKSNLPSRKTILKNGGQFENEVNVNGEITERFWISL